MYDFREDGNRVFMSRAGFSLFVNFEKDAICGSQQTHEPCSAFANLVSCPAAWNSQYDIDNECWLITVVEHSDVTWTRDQRIGVL